MWPSMQATDKIAVRGKEAAQLLGISKPTLLQWAKRPDFKAAFTIGGCTMYSVDRLREWVLEQVKSCDSDNAIHTSAEVEEEDIRYLTECIRSDYADMSEQIVEHISANPKGAPCVYFIDDGQFVKIGKAQDPLSRLREIQTGNARKLRLLLVITCQSEKEAFAVESIFHEKYKDYRQVGEWFDLRNRFN